MDRPPSLLGGAVVLKFADLGSARATGFCRHIVGGREVTDFAAVALAKYDSEPGVYVFYCDDSWNVITDTWHQDLEDAVHQARVEFDGITLVDP